MAEGAGFRLAAGPAVVFGLLGAVACLGRTAGHGALDTVWLEDGTVFLRDAARLSTLEALTTPYSGYFHLLPRVLAEVCVLFPAAWAAPVLAVQAAVVASGLGVVIYAASAAHLIRPLPRLLVSAAPVLAPAGYSELPNSINELRWLLMYAVFWMVLWVPARRLGQVVGTGVVVVSALTDNVVLVFLPLVLLRVWVRRDRYSVVVAASLLIGGAINAIAIATGATAHHEIRPRIDPLWAVGAYTIRPVPQAMVGERLVGLQPEHTLAGLWPVGLGWLVLGAVVVLAIRRATDPAWPLAIAAGGYSIVLYTVVLMIAGVAAPRYAGPAAMLVIVCAVALLRPTRPARRAEPLRWYATIMALVCALNYQGNQLRGAGPQWSTEVDIARTRCDATGETTVPVPVAPATMGWSADLPCGFLRRGPSRIGGR